MGAAARCTRPNLAGWLAQIYVYTRVHLAVNRPSGSGLALKNSFEPRQQLSRCRRRRCRLRAPTSLLGERISAYAMLCAPAGCWMPAQTHLHLRAHTHTHIPTCIHNVCVYSSPPRWPLYSAEHFTSTTATTTKLLRLQTPPRIMRTKSFGSSVTSDWGMGWMYVGLGMFGYGGSRGGKGANTYERHSWIRRTP